MANEQDIAHAEIWRGENSSRRRTQIAKKLSVQEARIIMKIRQSYYLVRHPGMRELISRATNELVMENTRAKKSHKFY